MGQKVKEIHKALLNHTFLICKNFCSFLLLVLETSSEWEEIELNTFIWHETLFKARGEANTKLKFS